MIAVLGAHGQIVLTADDRVEGGFGSVEVRNLGPGDAIIERIDLVVRWPSAEGREKQVRAPSLFGPLVVERGGTDPVLNFAILEASNPRDGWPVTLTDAFVDVHVTCVTPTERISLHHAFGLTSTPGSIVLASLGGRSQVHP